VKRLLRFTTEIHTLADGYVDAPIQPGYSQDFRSMTTWPCSPRDLRIPIELIAFFDIEGLRTSYRIVELGSPYDIVHMYGRMYSCFEIRDIEAARMICGQIFTLTVKNISDEPQSFNCEVWGVGVVFKMSNDIYRDVVKCGGCGASVSPEVKRCDYCNSWFSLKLDLQSVSFDKQVRNIACCGECGCATNPNHCKCDHCGSWFVEDLPTIHPIESSDSPSFIYAIDSGVVLLPPSVTCYISTTPHKRHIPQRIIMSAMVANSFHITEIRAGIEPILCTSNGPVLAGLLQEGVTFKRIIMDIGMDFTIEATNITTAPARFLCNVVGQYAPWTRYEVA